MSPDRIIFVASTLVVFNLLATQPTLAEVTGKRAGQTETWPPEWLEGLWSNTSTTITCEAQPTKKRFLCADYYIFLSGYRFSVYKGRRIRATPMIGQTRMDDVLHCLFRMTKDRTAMRANFSGDAQAAKYVSYLVSTSDTRRYKFERQLTRVASDEATLKILRDASEREFLSPHSDYAQGVFERWIQDREQSLAKN